MNDIYNFIDYRGATPTKITNGIPLVTAKNVKSGYIDYTIDDYISEEEFKERQQLSLIHIFLDFRHFERFFRFDQSDRKTYKKAISDGVNVSVVLDCGFGNTSKAVSYTHLSPMYSYPQMRSRSCSRVKT